MISNKKHSGADSDEERKQLNCGVPKEVKQPVHAGSQEKHDDGANSNISERVFFLILFSGIILSSAVFYVIALIH